MFTRRLETYSEKLLVFGPTTISLAVTPTWTYDPINLPKLFLISAIGLSLIPYVALNLKLILGKNKFALFLVGAFFATLIFNVTTSEIGSAQVFWGTWGRNTGVLTYSSYLIFFLAAAIYSKKFGPERVLRSFLICGYIIMLYTLIQFMELDPLPWSQKAPIATLGNVNFMSAFLGLLSIYFVVLILDKALSTTTRIYYLLLLLLATSLIWFSQSIQGLAILLSGVSTYLSIHFMKNSKAVGLMVFGGTAAIGTVSLMGSAGIGPLSRLLEQTTALYRLDYWRAGFRMFSDNLLSGVGLDGYGEYYRQYRDLEAATRTGPGRVTNTAHNVFLDILSGAGLFAGIFFVLLLFFALLISWKAALRIEKDSSILAIAPMVMGWLVFLVISIGQIGVNAWGVIFSGMAIGLRDAEVRRPKKLKSSSQTALRTSNATKEAPGTSSSTDVSKSMGILARTLPLVLCIVPLASMGGMLAMPPLVSDIEFMKGVKADDVDLIAKASRRAGSTNFHREYLIDTLISSGQLQEALIEARALVASEPRSWRGWVAIALSPKASVAERDKAYLVMENLDPYNSEVRSARRLLGDGHDNIP